MKLRAWGNEIAGLPLTMAGLCLAIKLRICVGQAAAKADNENITIDPVKNGDPSVKMR